MPVLLLLWITLFSQPLGFMKVVCTFVAENVNSWQKLKL